MSFKINHDFITLQIAEGDCLEFCWIGREPRLINKLKKINCASESLIILQDDVNRYHFRELIWRRFELGRGKVCTGTLRNSLALYATSSAARSKTYEGWISLLGNGNQVLGEN